MTRFNQQGSTSLNNNGAYNANVGMNHQDPASSNVNNSGGYNPGSQHGYSGNNSMNMDDNTVDVV